MNHTPVLLNEAIDHLNPTANGFYVDGTLGLGGHAAAILEASSPNGRLLGIDLDPEALAIAAQNLSEHTERLTLAQGNFAELERILESLELPCEVDGVLLDLGVSSFQLDTPARGFSFTHDAPLDMRMNPKQRLSAAEVVNRSSQEELARIFKEFGEERWAKRIAGRIVQARRETPIRTTHQLAELVRDAIPQRGANTRIHPATRTFQALRIYVNNELKNLQSGLDAAVSVLKPGGCLCVITFHSLEDRIVKDRFRTLARACICPPRTPICVCQHKPSLRILTKRPISPQPDEIQRNPRARSAKLRVAAKICES